jgi:alkylresorcinol/alkylpyrone synthase
MKAMPRVAACATALPPHGVSQEEAREICGRLYAGHPDLERLLAVFDRSGVARRYFAFPPDYYAAGHPFERRNADFVGQALGLAERAARACLEAAGTAPDQVDHLYLVTTTGLATPSLDALLVPRLGLRADVRRSPLFGLGCAGGAGGLIRAAEVLRSRPRQRALVVAAELCGQVFSPRALRPVDVVGTALFGDGAAAALVAGDDAAGTGPRVLGSRSVLFDDTRDLMGWDFTGDGMRLLLSPAVAGLVRERLKGVVEAFLADQGLESKKVRYWVLHPGGRRILEAYEAAFGLGPEALLWTRQSLARVGNLSSASVLFILSDVLAGARPKPGETGVVCALGPGFAAELVALGWE